MSTPTYILNVEGAIYKDNQWLLVKRSNKEPHEGGVWSLVGGKVEGLLTVPSLFEETIKREALEEVGIQIEEVKYVTSTSFMMQDKPVVDVICLCKYKNGETKVNDPDELTEFKWMTLAEIEENPEIKAWTKEYLRMASREV